MRLPLEANECECLKLIYSDKLSAEESTELVIPDTCPDVGRILDVRGQVFMVSKKAVSEGVLVSACVEADVLFATEEEGSLKSVGAKLSFEFSAISKGADEDCLVTAALELCKLEARMLNPRKLLVRAEISAAIKCYKTEFFTLWNSLPETEDTEVHLLKNEVVHSLVTCVAEKSFTVSEEYEVTGGGRDAQILSCVTDVCADDVKSVGNKLVFKATAQTNVTLIGSDGELFQSSYESQFSQIIELDGASEELEVDIILSLITADYVMLPDREDGIIAANFKVGVQAVCVRNMTSQFVADVYSNRFPLSLEAADVPIVTNEPPKRQKLRLEGSLGDGQFTVLYLHCGGVSAEIEGSKVSFVAKASGVGRNENGELVSLGATLRGSEEVFLEENQMLMIRGVSCGSASTNHSNGVFADLFYDQIIVTGRELKAISALELDVENPINNDDRPSIVVLCAQRNASLWSIAKKYGSTIEAIRGANSLCGEFSESMRPLIVPKG